MPAAIAPSRIATTSGASAADRAPISLKAPLSARSGHAEILELPGVDGIDILGKKDAAILQWRPIAVGTDDGAKIGQADFKDALEIHLVGLDDAGIRVLDRPNHTGENGDGHLQAGRVVVRHQGARLVRGQLRAVPIRPARVPHQQYAELVDAGDDLVHHQALRLLLVPVLAVAHRQIVGDRDRFAVGDEEAVKGPFERRPGAHPRRGARTAQPDGAVAAEFVMRAVGGKMPLVAAPAELGRLRALADEAFDRPGIDELARPLGDVGDLGVALGDVDDLDAERLGERAPAGTRSGLGNRPSGITGEVEQRLLDEMRDEARIGAMRQHGGRRRAWLAQLERPLAQGIVGAQRGRQRGIGIAARPRLDAGIEIERAGLARELDEREARDLDGEVEEEIAGGEQRRQHLAIVLAGQRHPQEAHAIFPGDFGAALLSGDDGDALRLHPDMAQQERQYALADAAETDHDETAGKGDVKLAGVLMRGWAHGRTLALTGWTRVCGEGLVEKGRRMRRRTYGPADTLSRSVA